MEKKNKFLILLMLVVLASPIFNSCKKGADDPFISLRSRTSRLKGAWDLTSGTETGTTDSSAYTKTFTESIVTITSGGQTTTNTHSEKMEFLKDNAFKGTKINNGVASIGEGFWAFMDGYDDVKNKECVVIRISSQTNGGTITSYTGDNMPAHIVRFDKLSGSEIIIEANGTIIGASAGTSTSTKTYKKE